METNKNASKEKIPSKSNRKSISRKMQRIKLEEERNDSTGLLKSINEHSQSIQERNQFKTPKFFFIYDFIFKNDTLTSTEKIILAYIISYNRKRKSFYATNSHIQRVLKISSTTVTKSIKSLKEEGYITLTFGKGGFRSIMFTSKVIKLLEKNGTHNQANIDRDK